MGDTAMAGGSEGLRAGSLRVLVVDDEEPIRVAIRIVLERRGHSVSEAASTREGLARALESTPDVALVDLRLPGNGLTLLRELDGIPALIGRTVLMTGSVDLLMNEDGSLVWPRWIGKPFDFEQLVELVEELGYGEDGKDLLT